MLTRMHAHQPHRHTVIKHSKFQHSIFKPFALIFFTSLLLCSAFISGCEKDDTRVATETHNAQSDTKDNTKQNTASDAEAPSLIDTGSTEAIDDESLKNSETKPQPVKAQDVTFKAVPLDYQLPKQVSEMCVNESDNEPDIEPGIKSNIESVTDTSSEKPRCPIIDVKLASAHPKWIENALNLQITEDNNPDRLKFKRELDRFAISQIEDESPLGYSMYINPEQKTAHNNVAQFSIINDMYLGGAHGMPTIEYLLFDMDLKSQIDLYDVLDDKEGKFHDLAHQAFLEYLSETLDIVAPDDIADYESSWPFNLSDVFYFDSEAAKKDKEYTGLVLVYQPYQLGSYAQGFIELTIPYSELEGVLKPQYLPK